jgi:hypothetical protein
MGWSLGCILLFEVQTSFFGGFDKGVDWITDRSGLFMIRILGTDTRISDKK